MPQRIRIVTNLLEHVNICHCTEVWKYYFEFYGTNWPWFVLYNWISTVILFYYTRVLMTPGVCFTKKYVRVRYSRSVLTYCYSATVRGHEVYLNKHACQTWGSPPPMAYLTLRRVCRHPIWGVRRTTYCSSWYAQSWNSQFFPEVQNCPLKKLRCNSFKLRCNFQVHLWFNIITWFGVQKPRSHFC